MNGKTELATLISSMVLICGILVFVDQQKILLICLSIALGLAAFFLIKWVKTHRDKLHLTQELANQRQQKKDLEASQEQLELFMAHTPFGIQIFASDGTLIHVNQTWEKMWGVAGEEIVGKYNAFQDPQLERMGLMQLIKKAFAGESTDFHDTFYSPKLQGMPGRDRWIRAHSYLMPNLHDSPPTLVLISEDITQRKMAEQELQRSQEKLEELVAERTEELNRKVEEGQQLNRQLREANQELESFSSSVSHDLRTPLRHIHGFIRLLRKREGDRFDETSTHYLDFTIEAVHKMKQLIDDLLAFSRTNRIEMETEEVDVQLLIEQARKELTPDMEDRDIQWVVGAFPKVLGDSQSAQNCLGSTFFRMPSNIQPQKIRLFIEIGMIEENGLIWQEEDMNNIILYVKDNGIGFDSTYAHRIFGVFQRLHKSEDFEGTGIGLATVRRIIQRHGGHIWAHGTPDQGAIFYFTLQKFRGTPVQ